MDEGLLERWRTVLSREEFRENLIQVLQKHGFAQQDAEAGARWIQDLGIKQNPVSSAVGESRLRDA